MFVKQAIREVLKCARARMPVLLLGSPGVSKTTIARYLARELGLPYRELRCAEFESVDFRGVCVPDLATGKTRWLTPDFWPTEACVLNFDEITQAAPELTSPLLKIFLGGEIGDYKLPEGTVLIATGNLVTDKAGCSRVTSALRERCVVITVEANATDWLEWYATDETYNSTVASFIASNPSLLHKWDGRLDHNQPNPRNWVRVGNLLPLDPVVETVAGIIGPEYAQTFMSYARTVKPVANVLEYARGSVSLPKSPAMVQTIIETAGEEVASGQHDAEDVDAIAAMVSALPGTYQVSFLKIVAKRNPKALRSGALGKMLAVHAAAIREAVSK
jgi:hypothetical protein